ncbi:glycosyltransferase family 2 protein [Paenibacillus thalictri]|uniref:Glycosyltransferase n=1 Tax=Paenibacillus thalictri TaxID=2527873 RepID=A0A4Q9DM19_9BACL|nr:glycosyltransferase family 2 protein [Paenibacillus thalictri]TBL75102.1 glycosyltransferase [Paenibacillus thalictri]
MMGPHVQSTDDSLNRQEQAQGRWEHIVANLKEQRFEEAERLAVKELRDQPLAAQLWVLLGETLLHQGHGAAAQLVFNRAWLLDPEASWVAGIMQQLQMTPIGPQREDIAALLAVKKVTVTIGVLVRDDERTIHRCLSSLEGAADDIVVVDCESKDRTVEIAESFPGVRVVRTTWKDSFAELRNEGLAHMHTDWVLWVDADEYLHPDDRSAVREAAGLFDAIGVPPILYIWQMNQVQGTVLHEFSQTRMFSLRHNVKYHGRVHEQVGPAEGDLYSAPAFRKAVRIRLHHDGYEQAVMQHKNKIQRNLRLLGMMVQEEPDNPGWWVFYGRESLAAGLPDQALEALAQAELTARNKPSFARMLDVYMLTVKIRLSRKEWALAEQVCLQALERYPDFPDAKFYLATAKMNKAFAQIREAEQLLRQSKDDFVTYRGNVAPDHEIAKWKADVTLADIARSVGRFADAANIYNRIGETYPYVQQVRKPLELLEEQLAKLQPQKGERRS